MRVAWGNVSSSVLECGAEERVALGASEQQHVRVDVVERVGGPAISLMSAKSWCSVGARARMVTSSGAALRSSAFIASVVSLFHDEARDGLDRGRREVRFVHAGDERGRDPPGGELAVESGGGEARPGGVGHEGWFVERELREIGPLLRRAQADERADADAEDALARRCGR